MTNPSRGWTKWHKAALVSAFCLLLPVVVGSAYLKLYLEVAEARKTWRSAPGVVLESKLERSRGDNPNWRPLLRYQYTVGQRQFSGSRYELGGVTESANRVAMQAIVDSHPPGKPVTVFHHPADPARSALLLQMADASHIIWVIGCCFVAVGLLLWMTRQLRE